MASAIIYALAAGMAWWVSLTFIAMGNKRCLINVLAAALLSGFVTLGLNSAGMTQEGLFIGELAICVGMAAAVYIQSDHVWTDAMISFFLSLGAVSILLLAFGIPGKVESADAAAGIAVLLIFASAAQKLRSRCRDSGWREYYKRKEDGERIQLKIGYVYGILALIGLGPAIGLWAGGSGGIVTRILWIAMGIVLYWLGIFAVILMNTCQKERSTILAEQQYREEMENFMNVIRSQRHDYNFHVQTIAGLIHAGKIEECVRYVDDLERDAEVMNAVLPVKDAAISALIHNFQMRAAGNGIRLYIDIQNDLAQIATNVYETNKIISNLLQNALDETMTHTDKSYGIHLSILKRGEYCVIRVSNELKEGAGDMQELGHIYQYGYTTKQGHDGVGLSSIRTLVTRYHGVIYTEVEDRIIYFVVRVPLNYAKAAPE